MAKLSGEEKFAMYLGTAIGFVIRYVAIGALLYIGYRWVSK